MNDKYQRHEGCIFTVDVEDYFHVEAFASMIDSSKWDQYSQRVERNTIHLLEILKDFGVKGTFYFLGWVAERHPGIVCMTLDAGHEIASHGYNHCMVSKMTMDEFRKDVRKSKEILEKITKQRVLGYRAPTFSMNSNTRWAYNILFEEGYRYSNSVFPIRHFQYGWPEFGYEPKKMVTNGREEMWEIPLSVGFFGPIKVPFGGGGYLRAYPVSLTKYLFRSRLKNKKHGIVYIHPWELDMKQPYIQAPLISRIRHYQGIFSCEKKLLSLFNSFKFIQMKDFIRDLK